jgi:predicted nucleic acid-binding protein
VRLVVDASVLVAELLRRRGRALISSPGLELFIAEQAWSEAQHELSERAQVMEQQGRVPVGAGVRLLEAAFSVVELSVTPVPTEIYAHLADAARARIPRDPADWPTVALAMVLDAAIWTRDQDFLGCGLPTWTTETLLAYLGARDED